MSCNREMISKEKMTAMLQDLKRVFYKNGFSLGGIKKLAITVEDDGLLIQHNAPPELSDPERYPRHRKGAGAKEKLISSLIPLNLHTWEREYVDPKAAPEEYWDLSVTFLTDKYEPLYFQGIGKYPPEWQGLINIINEYSPLCLEDEEQ